MEKEKKEIEIKLLSIRESEFYINLEEIDTIIDFQINKIKIGFNYKCTPDLEKETMSIDLEIQYVYPKENSSIELLKAKSLNVFSIHDMKEVIEMNGDTFSCNSEMMHSFLDIAIGAMRGILLVKTAGTVLEKPLPIMDASLFDPQKNS